MFVYGREKQAWGRGIYEVEPIGGSVVRFFGVSGPLGPIYPIWEACWVSGRNFEDKSCTDCNGDNTNN